jgi:AcrR family transcriptional regulator
MDKPKGRNWEILGKAARLFRERGYPGTSIRDIGDALGVTSAALYYHFKNKDEVLLGIMEQSLKEVQQRVGDAIEGVQDPWDRIRTALKTHLDVSLQYQDHAIVLLNELRHLQPEGRAKIIAERDRYDAMWTELFEAAKREGLIREGVDLHLLRLMTFGAVNLVVTWFNPKGPYDPNEICEQFLSYIGKGVEVPG